MKAKIVKKIIGENIFWNFGVEEKINGCAFFQILFLEFFKNKFEFWNQDFGSTSSLVQHPDFTLGEWTINEVILTKKH